MSEDNAARSRGPEAISLPGRVKPYDDLDPEMMKRASEAAALLKALAHDGRIVILYHLVSGEKTVSELEHLLGQRQAAVSQQLARLRSERLVSYRRDGKARLYSISDRRAAAVIELMYDLYCPDEH